MNDYGGENRIRGQNLLIVEGHHEKDRLFWLIFKCFPEMNIDMDAIWIYGTNIYHLYDDIVKEYGEHWAEDGDDIDLPFIISKKLYPDELRYKEDFTNIFLVFDYERHDVNFSEEKILQMQRCFTDSADMGQLYINYPMLESYQHLRGLPDRGYMQRQIPVALQPGKEYKNLVARETVLGDLVEFPHRIDDLLKKHFEISDEKMRRKCCNAILDIKETIGVENMVGAALRKTIEDKYILTAKGQLVNWIIKRGYLKRNQTYWEYMREVLRQIIQHNICKAYKIQYDKYEGAEEDYKGAFEKINLIEILKIQNLSSKDIEEGTIWVLNTCVFAVAEYNFNLLTDTAV